MASATPTRASQNNSFQQSSIRMRTEPLPTKLSSRRPFNQDSRTNKQTYATSPTSSTTRQEHLQQQLNQHYDMRDRSDASQSSSESEFTIKTQLTQQRQFGTNILNTSSPNFLKTTRDSPIIKRGSKRVIIQSGSDTEQSTHDLQLPDNTGITHALSSPLKPRIPTPITTTTTTAPNRHHDDAPALAHIHSTNHDLTHRLTHLESILTPSNNFLTREEFTNGINRIQSQVNLLSEKLTGLNQQVHGASAVLQEYIEKATVDDKWQQEINDRKAQFGDHDTTPKPKHRHVKITQPEKRFFSGPQTPSVRSTSPSIKFDQNPAHHLNIELCPPTLPKSVQEIDRKVTQARHSRPCRNCNFIDDQPPSPISSNRSPVPASSSPTIKEKTDNVRLTEKEKIQQEAILKYLAERPIFAKRRGLEEEFAKAVREYDNQKRLFMGLSKQFSDVGACDKPYIRIGLANSINQVIQTINQRGSEVVEIQERIQALPNTIYHDSFQHSDRLNEGIL